MLPLILLCLAQFMVILDVTVVNVALPSIGADLGIAHADLGLVVTAYTVVFGGLLLAGGRAADVLGARRTFLAGLGLFTAASLGAGLAGSDTVLFGARAAQGVGAALLSPAALSLLIASYPSGPEHRRAFAAWGAMAALGVAVGVLLGGLLTETVGWEGVFLINLPVGIAVGVLAPRALPDPAPRGGGLALPSALLATATMGGLLLGITEDAAAGYVVAVAAALGLAAVERRASAPLLPLAALRRRTTVAGLAMMFCAAGSMVSVFFLTSVHLQQELGHSALRTGLEFLPLAVVVAFASRAGAHLLGRVGTRPVATTGLLGAATGALLLSGADGYGEVLPGMLVFAAGVGLAFSTIGLTAMAGAPRESLGVLSATLTTAHELGASIMVALVAASASGDGYTIAAVAAGGGAVVAAAMLRREDVPQGAAPAFAH